ncbi:MAG: sulfotransferase family protein, partial [Actinomycetota bacterium]|nr:sulfotransferase family protein [Actinomycetota bacterium]
GPDWVELGVDHSVWGNPMRLRTGREPLRRDDSWRAGLPAADRRIVTALSLPALARYGYLGAGQSGSRLRNPASY